ncbi:competence/damage-inducible protein A [Halovivax limisalsi]|uniref:competence/damage-inducible protein A n=1 Tax=Halovivax limisalsi TaxID=1453760 RepID=UPI001FFD9977|nr:competence/damage-inducible protein A [Halovivax limisalsi]
MDVAILTVGDELLAGETTNTNASWLAGRLADRGARTRRIATVPDDRAAIGEYVSRFREEFDAVLVTGGLGNTHDDVTAEAVAAALDRDLVAPESLQERLREKAARVREERPELFEEHDLELDAEAAARVPTGARPVVTDAGWAPAFVVDRVYVLPGIPAEMEAAFERVATDFDGDAISRSIFTPLPEGALPSVLETVRDRFDVAVGSYPGADAAPGRIRVSASEPSSVAAAIEWLESTIETVDPPVETDN